MSGRQALCEDCKDGVSRSVENKPVSKSNSPLSRARMSDDRDCGNGLSETDDGRKASDLGVKARANRLTGCVPG